MDDFGTGYSSLTYLKRFPVDMIKIDRSFVAGLGLDQDDSTIVEAVVRLGHAFDMSVVAEGLETPLQLARLRELGCDRGQGYLFGRPRPAALLEHDRSRRAGSYRHRQCGGAARSAPVLTRDPERMNQRRAGGWTDGRC